MMQPAGGITRAEAEACMAVLSAGHETPDPPQLIENWSDGETKYPWAIAWNGPSGWQEAGIELPGGISASAYYSFLAVLYR